MAATLRIIITSSSSIRGACVRIQPSIAPAQLPPRRLHSLRAFSVSASHPKNSIGPLPTFNPTSSSDLDTLLAHLRKEMFTGPHLLQRQLPLIRRQKYHQVLEEDPIYFPIGDQTVQLTPKQVHHRLPRKMFTKAVQMMTTPSDFDAIPPLVLGYTQAGLPLLEKHISAAVRRAGLNGRADVLPQILDQAEYNNILIPVVTAREGFRGFTVTARLPSKNAAIKAVRGARRLRHLLGKQDSLELGKYDSAAAALSESKTQYGIEAELGEAPVSVAKDPVGLGTLAGITSLASKRFNGGLDHGSYTARYIEKLLSPESWGIVKKQLGAKWESVYDPSKYAETREAFHTRKKSIMDINVLIDSIKTAGEVLEKTSAHILATPAAPGLDPSIFNTKHGVTAKNIKDHGNEVGKLAKRLKLEIPIMEQALSRWVEVMVGDGDKVMKWSEEETRKRMDGTRLRYDWAAGELANKVEVGKEVEDGN